MKKVLVAASLLFFLPVLTVWAATCEVKPVCIDNSHLGMQMEDCKVLSYLEFMNQVSSAFGQGTASASEVSYSCYIRCQDGMCITDNTPDVCQDTDNGTDYFVQGTVTNRGGGEEGVASDHCSDETTLIEYSCEKRGSEYLIATTDYKCPNGCLHGACAKTASGGSGSTCADTDGGKDIYRAGEISINGEKLELSDTCDFDPQMITEMYCRSDGTYASEEIKCPGLCEIMPDTFGYAYCTKTCEKSHGYYCRRTPEGGQGIAFLTTGCQWEKATPCQSNGCSTGSCMTAGNLIDTDGDGLLDVNEAKWGTDPNKFDTDGDGYGDMTEIDAGYDPLTGGKFTSEQVALAAAMAAESQNVQSPDSALASGSTTTPTGEVATSSSVISDLINRQLSNDLRARSDKNNYFNPGAWLVWLITFLVIASYVYSSLCFHLIARKLGIAWAWVAWIPIANYFLMVKCAGKPLWWFVFFLIPFVNIVFGILFWVWIAKNLGKSPVLGVLMIIPLLNFVIIGYLAFSKIYWPAGAEDSQLQPPTQLT